MTPFLRRFRYTLIALCIAIVVMVLIRPFFDKNVDIDVVSLKRSVTVTTTELTSLDPHRHGAEDSVTDAHHGVIVEAPEFTVPEDMWVNDITLEMHNAPKVVLHHLNLFAVVPYGYDLPDGSPAVRHEEIVSFGQDTSTNFHYNDPYAIYLPKGTTLDLSAMFHNPRPPKGPGEEYTHVSASVRLTGPLFHSGNPKEIHVQRLALSDPDSTSKETFVVPAHTNEYIKTAKNDAFGKASYTFPYPATIVRMGAHLHAWEGGERVDAYLNGDHLMTFESKKDGDNAWDWYTQASEIPIHVHAGDTITLSATYSNPGDEPLVGAMGMLSFRFAPEITVTTKKPEGFFSSLLP